MSEFFGRILKYHERGWAFIKREDGQPDVFLHANEMQAAGISADTGVLNVRVSFRIRQRADGKPYAVDVEVL
jgi:cold shock CspA family protein